MSDGDRALRIMLYGVFTLSGTAGLIYESIWSRYLALFVGHGAYAQVIVLAIFLGGMSVGALVAGQRSARLSEPLLWYAGVEFAVGIVGLIFHSAYLAVTQWAYDVVFPLLAGHAALTVAKWSIASALILPQSVLLGTTFPFMSAGVLRRTAGQPGRVLALLYFANSLGAAAGALLAGFYLIALLGLPGTILTAATVNLLVGLAIYLGARSRPAAGGAPAAWAIAPAPAAAASLRLGLTGQRLWQLLLVVSFGTATASFIYEITWIRMLSLVLGSATHSFELMLSAFILGLALGALWVRQRADRFADPLHALGTVQWLMGCAALATLPLYLASFDWMAGLLATFTKTTSGYVGFNLARYAICLAVMLPSTLCAGVTLPLITKTLLVAGRGERAIGWVYGINTLGSIVGVILAGLVLLPWIGLKALLIVGATLDMGLGVLLLACGNGTRRVRIPLTAAAAIASALIVALVSVGAKFDRVVMTSGVYRHGRVPGSENLEVVFYKDGRTATVAAIRGVRDKGISLSTNGKPDASLGADWLADGDPARPRRPLNGDPVAQTLLPLITLAHAPQARTAAVIGHGSGLSSHLLLGSPHLAHLVTIDIEPEMIEGSRAFYPANRRVFDDPRSEFAIDDAKSFFAAHPQRYDLILSEPSNPWVSGVSNLFTTEFYARLKSRLSDHGVFGQWLHLYELSDGLALSVLAALHENFQSYEIFLLDPGDVLIVASNAPHLPPADWSVFSLPDIAADLRLFIPLTPESLDATRLIDRTTLAPLLDTWQQPNSDFFPALDLGAEEARYLVSLAAGFSGLLSDRFDIAAPFFGRRSSFGEVEDAPVPAHPRMQARALSATLRAVPHRAAPTAPTTDPGVTAAVHRLWRWQSTLASNRPPADWWLWLDDTMRVEYDLHAGTAGMVDEDFYRALHRYIEAHPPPQEVRDAITFAEGLARWDFAAAAHSADRLLEPAVTGAARVPVDELRDGAVVSKLLTGDTAGARRYFDALATKVRREPSDLRSRLLEAYLVKAERVAQQPPGTTMSSVR